MFLSRKSVLLAFIKFIPITKLRYFLRWCVHTDFYNDYCYEEHIKYLALYENKNDIETVILGSSHANYDYVPQKTECNLGGNSQDLYLSYNIYKYLTEHDFKKLKNVVLFYDVFSDGLDLSKTRIHFVCIPYKLFYGIPYRIKLSFKSRIIERKCQKQLQNKTFSAPEGYKGMSLYKIWNKDIDVTKRVESHLKNNRRKISQTSYLNNLINKCKKNGHILYIVNPPLRKDYLDLLPDYNEIFACLLKSVKGKINVKLLNYQSDTDFYYSDFGDCDHLNKRGATKLANKIRKVMNND